jgi:hypothetical protein
VGSGRQFHCATVNASFVKCSVEQGAAAAPLQLRQRTAHFALV